MLDVRCSMFDVNFLVNQLYKLYYQSFFFLLRLADFQANDGLNPGTSNCQRKTTLYGEI